MLCADERGGDVNAKFLGHTWSCGYCGEVSEGPPPESKSYFDFENWGVDEGQQLEADSSAVEISTFIRAHVQTREATVCSTCGLIDTDEVYEEEASWQCTPCGEIFDNQADAEGCCAYRARRIEHEIETAKAMLQRVGYQVSEPPTPSLKNSEPDAQAGLGKVDW